jgi:hypothetical protein
MDSDATVHDSVLVTLQLQVGLQYGILGFRSHSTIALGPATRVSEI